MVLRHWVAPLEGRKGGGNSFPTRHSMIGANVRTPSRRVAAVNERVQSSTAPAWYLVAVAAVTFMVTLTVHPYEESQH
jgi:hypothetical protein